MSMRTRSREREPRPEDLQYASYWDRRYEIDQEDAAATAVSETKDSKAGLDSILATNTDTSTTDISPNGAKSAHIPDYDWFRNFSAIQPFLNTHLPVAPTSPHILHLGCGNSTLPSDLHALSYHSQTAVDFSQVCITAMSRKYASLDPPVSWLFADVRDMRTQFVNRSFDVAIDKGTLDAMLHGSLWDPPDDVRESVGKYTDEVARVLKPGGIWLYVTYRQPHFMKPLLEKEGVWKAECETLSGEGGSFEYFGWVMRKQG